ncbi:MAG: hypothetical protein ABI568_13160 [Pseudarthrobacter sp.]
MERAFAAKTTLKSRIGRPEWLRGIGIAADPDGTPYVKVNVAALTPEVREAVPEEIDGVLIRVETVGDIKPM